MKVEQSYIISGCRVDKELVVGNIEVYTDIDSEVAYIAIAGEVKIRIEVNAYTGEGGGGSLQIQKV